MFSKVKNRLLTNLLSFLALGILIVMVVVGFVLLSYTADWRWRQTPGESAWYESLQLCQQPSPGDWSSVINQVTDALLTQK